VCDCSDQAAHYHNLGPQLGASLLTRHIGWKQKQKVKKKHFLLLSENTYNKVSARCHNYNSSALTGVGYDVARVREISE
jgi:hypothetical protein